MRLGFLLLCMSYPIFHSPNILHFLTNFSVVTYKLPTWHKSSFPLTTSNRNIMSVLAAIGVLWRILVFLNVLDTFQQLGNRMLPRAKPEPRMANVERLRQV